MHPALDTTHFTLHLRVKFLLDFAMPGRLAEAEKGMKSKLTKAEADLESTKKRLDVTAEALRLQKDLRMKEMLRQQVRGSKQCNFSKSGMTMIVARVGRRKSEALTVCAQREGTSIDLLFER